MKAGFAETDISPSVGTRKIGWMENLKCEVMLDPLFARIAIFDDRKEKLAFVQLDTLSVRWTQTNEIRKGVEKEYGFPIENIMVSATHNHAGPALSSVYPVDRDDEYNEFLVGKCVKCFGEALKRIEDVEIGFERSLNFEVAHNRRSVMLDGTVRTQTYSSDPDFLHLEGPMDPELAVLAAKDKEGNFLGSLINYACHPTHHGGSNECSAGFPGVVARKMKEYGCPVSLYLNGAYGNVLDVDFERNTRFSMEEAGISLFKSAKDAIEKMSFSGDGKLGAKKETIQLEYRNITEDEYKGRVRGVQRFRSDELYETFIDGLKKRIAERGTQPAEIQAFRIGDIYFAGVPAEYFVEFQLRIKEESYPKRALVVGGANGMTSYIPTKEAFTRGGYETTLGPPSYMAPETGDLIADKTIELIKEL
jgi:hypothetical protein